MNSISDFFQKFLNIQKSSALKTEMILSAIKKEANIDVPKETLCFKGENLKINCSPVMRNEIFMHKAQIEDCLRSQKIFLTIV